MVPAHRPKPVNRKPAQPPAPRPHLIPPPSGRRVPEAALALHTSQRRPHCSGVKSFSPNQRMISMRRHSREDSAKLICGTCRGSVGQISTTSIAVKQCCLVTCLLLLVVFVALACSPSAQRPERPHTQERTLS